MKKLVLIFGVFAIICVIISVALSTNTQGNLSMEASDEQSATQSEMYVVKSENGRVVMYKGDMLILRTTTSVSTLPKKDERALLYGIQVKTRQEADKLLEQYCS